MVARNDWALDGNKINNNAVGIGFFVAYLTARSKLGVAFRPLPRCGRLPLSYAYGIRLHPRPSLGGENEVRTAFGLISIVKSNVC